MEKFALVDERVDADPERRANANANEMDKAVSPCGERIRETRIERGDHLVKVVQGVKDVNRHNALALPSTDHRLRPRRDGRLPSRDSSANDRR